MEAEATSVKTAAPVALIATTIGTLICAIVGYYGRVADVVLMRFTDLILAVPLLAVLLVLAGAALSAPETSTVLAGNLELAHHDIQRRRGIRAPALGTRLDPVAQGAHQVDELVRLARLLPRFQQRPGKPSLCRLVEV
jgi:hypothetical protein